MFKSQQVKDVSTSHGQVLTITVTYKEVNGHVYVTMKISKLQSSKAKMLDEVGE